MSPFFYYKLLDVRVAGSSTVTLKVSTVKGDSCYLLLILHECFLVSGSLF